MTDHHAIRLFSPNINPPITKRRSMQPKEGPGPLGSTGFGEAPSPGGGSITGPGGQAPPFAPGGPENPYPPSAGMPPPNISLPPGSSAMQPGFMGSGAPGSQGYPVPPKSSAGMGMPAGMPPGYIPGQTGGGSRPPMQPGMQPQQQQRGRSSDPGFTARIIPLEGGGPIHPEPPTVPPGPEPPVPPDLGGGPSQGKPRGLRTLPMPEHHQPPEGPPKPPGQWVTVNAGKGLPPAWGYLPKEEVDTGEDSGLEGAAKKSRSGTSGHGTGAGPSGSTGAKPSGAQAGSENGQKGHYVPVQVPGKEPRFGRSEDEEDEPTWCWIPQIDENYGVKHKEKEKPEETAPKKV